MEKVFTSSRYEMLYYDGRSGPGTPNHFRHCSPQHMHSELIAGTFRIEHFDLIFMLVRNPLARFQSEYLWQNRSHVRALDPDHVTRWATDSFTAYADNNFIYDNHLRPQSQFETSKCELYYLEDGIEAAVDDLNLRFGLSLRNRIRKEKNARKVTGLLSRDVPISPVLQKQIEGFYTDDYEKYGYSKG